MIDSLQENGTACITGYLLKYNMIQFMGSLNEIPAPNDKKLKEIIFMKDTGATVSTISRKSLLELGYTHKYINDHLEKVPSVKLASVKLEIGMIKIPVFQIVGREFINYSLRVVTYNEFIKGRDLPNLLGLDFGRYFNYREIFESWEFEITPTKPKNGLLIDRENQSINFLDN